MSRHRCLYIKTEVQHSLSCLLVPGSLSLIGSHVPDSQSLRHLGIQTDSFIHSSHNMSLTEKPMAHRLPRTYYCNVNSWIPTTATALPRRPSHLLHNINIVSINVSQLLTGHTIVIPPVTPSLPLSTHLHSHTPLYQTFAGTNERIADPYPSTFLKTPHHAFRFRVEAFSQRILILIYPSLQVPTLQRVYDKSLSVHINRHPCIPSGIPRDLATFLIPYSHSHSHSHSYSHS